MGCGFCDALTERARSHRNGITCAPPAATAPLGYVYPQRRYGAWG